MEMKDYQLRGVKVRYVEAEGPSPSIVFLHGVTDSLTSYLAPMSMLGGEFRMLAMDFRGHGLSGHTPGEYRVRDYAEDVLEFVNGVVREPALVVGHSLGSMVAASMSSVAPGLVRGVFLEDPPFYTAQMPAFRDTSDHRAFGGLREVLRQHKEAGQSVDALAQLVGTWPIHPLLFDGRSLLDIAGPEVVRARAESLHRMDVEALQPVLDGTQFDGFNPDEALAKIASPVHLLAGEVSLGGAVEQRDVERLASVIRRYTHRMLPGVGHMIHHTAPTDYVSEVRALAETCRSEETEEG
jgi:pimeloyl-ACP methyl ester carboxylesterase